MDAAIINSIGNGLLVTLKISFFSILWGTILGCIVCKLLLSEIKPVRWLAKAYISINTGIPVLMTLLLMYYVVFARSGLEASIVAIFVFSINISASIGEMLQDAILSLDKGKLEAAETLGLSRFQTSYYLVFPYVVQASASTYESIIISLIQNTSILGYIAITDFTRVLNTISSRTMQPVLYILIGMGIYLGITYLVKAIFIIVKKIGARKKHG